MKNGDYSLLVAPDGYPGKRYRGRYAYKHWIVWWQNTGSIPGVGQVIHHINHDRYDNSFKNLMLMTSEGHASLHYSLKGKPAEMMRLTCAYCGELFERGASYVRSKRKVGYKNSFCCRSHQVKQQWRDGVIFGGKYHN